MGVSAKRIVVTGMGIVSPLGCGVQHVWQSLLAGKSGITRLSEQMVEDIPCKVAGSVHRTRSAARLRSAGDHPGQGTQKDGSLYRICAGCRA